MPLQYYELVASKSPGSAGFALDQGKGTAMYDVTDPLYVSNAVVDLLGATDTAVSTTGKLKRQLPKAHPFFPWLYAERVSNIQGVGRPVTFDLSATYEVPLVVPRIALYPRYRLTVEFVQRPYAIVSDDNIPVVTANWDNVAGVSTAYKSTKEYVRFTDYDIEPDVDVVTAQHGKLIFRSSDSTNGKSFTGMPRISIAKAVIKFRWFGIPFRYLESANSYLVGYINYINQDPFWQWEEGSLLYRGLRVLRRYTPAVPDTNLVFGTTAYTPDKLCDVELLWEWTDRALTSFPGGLANTNCIAAGHNLMPHYLGGFYYVTDANASTAAQKPLFRSVPFDLLFTDPDT